MTRGTTPLLAFRVGFDTSEISKLYITISQYRKKVIEKDISNCQINGNMITTRLTQEDTLKLTPDILVEVQMRCLLDDGNAIASNIISCPAGRILKEGAI